MRSWYVEIKCYYVKISYLFILYVKQIHFNYLSLVYLCKAPNFCRVRTIIAYIISLHFLFCYVFARVLLVSWVVKTAERLFPQERANGMLLSPGQMRICGSLSELIHPNQMNGRSLWVQMILYMLHEHFSEQSLNPLGILYSKCNK